MTRLHPCLRPLVVLAVLSLIGAGAHAAPARKKPSKKPAAAAKAPTVSGEIELVHELGSDKGAELSQDRRALQCDEPGRHRPHRRAQVGRGRNPRPDDPGRGQRGPTACRQAALSAAQRRHEGSARAASKSVRAPATMSPTPLDARGNLVALPIDLGTPIMYINATPSARRGSIPTRRPPPGSACRTRSASCTTRAMAVPTRLPSPAGSMSRTPAPGTTRQLAATSGKREVLAVNNLLQVKHLAMMKSWVTSRYMHVFGDGLDAEVPVRGRQLRRAHRLVQRLPEPSSATRSSRSVWRHCRTMTTFPVRRRTRSPMVRRCGSARANPRRSTGSPHVSSPTCCRRRPRSSCRSIWVRCRSTGPVCWLRAASC